MAENKPIGATLELVYVPDTYTETERQEGASWPLGSGYYDLVVLADDARFTLHRFKAGAIDKAFALAKSKKDEQAQRPQTTLSPVQQQAQQTTTGSSTETTFHQQPVQQQQQPEQAPPPEQQQTPPPPEQQQPQ